MANSDSILLRIAEALERIAPASPDAIDWRSAPAFVWDGKTAQSVAALGALPLATLRGIDRQKEAVVSNVRRLAAGHASHDMLLWGARGMGKSALVRSAVAEVQNEQPHPLTLIQLRTTDTSAIARLIAILAEQDGAYLLYCDDLGFGSDDVTATLALRSLLDGGIAPRPGHVRLAVTSNRRAIVSRDGDGGALHERDERDNALALADRFGLTLGFHPADREAYLDMVSAYAEPAGLEYDEEDALAWAIARGNRSGRTAYQYAVELAGRAGKSL